MDSHVTKSTLKTLYGLVMFLALAMCLVPLHAQVVTVSVQGRVYDPTGAAIPAANITVVNSETGFSRSMTATAGGDYQFSALPVGDYTITAEKAGFQKSAKKVRLEVGAAGNVDFNLAPGQVVTEVTVQDVGEVVEPTRTMVSSVIDEQKIDNLPVNRNAACHVEPEFEGSLVDVGFTSHTVTWCTSHLEQSRIFSLRRSECPISEPSRLAEAIEEIAVDQHHHRKDQRIPVLPLQFRHVIEVHSSCPGSRTATQTKHSGRRM